MELGAYMYYTREFWNKQLKHEMWQQIKHVKITGTRNQRLTVYFSFFKDIFSSLACKPYLKNEKIALLSDLLKRQYVFLCRKYLGNREL